MSLFIPNSFQVPNALVDELIADLTGAELKIYLFVIRKTKGWNKESDAISISQFMETLKLSNRAVIDACRSLIEKGLLVQNVGVRGVKVYSATPCKNFTREESSPVKKVHGIYEESSLDPVKKVHTQNNNIKNTTQNTNKKNIKKPTACDEDFEECFERFWQAGMRKAKKSQSLLKFQSAYQRWRKENPDKPNRLDDFTCLLVDDIQRRIALGQFGFAELHPTTYLNNQRWQDDLPKQPIAKHSARVETITNFSNLHYGKTQIPDWAKDAFNE